MYLYIVQGAFIIFSGFMYVRIYNDLHVWLEKIAQHYYNIARTIVCTNDKKKNVGKYPAEKFNETEVTRANVP